MKKYYLLLCIVMWSMVAIAQEQKKLTLSGFTIEVNNNKIEYDQTVTEILNDLEPKAVRVFDGEELDYLVEFKFKRDGNRIKIRRSSEVVMKDGTKIKGNTKKEVQYMSSSAPGEFEFPVAENIVLDKKKYSTFFISYRTKVKYK